MELPDQTPVTYGSRGLDKWLRSTEVVHFLGKEEVTSSNLVGASIIITMKHGWFCSVVEQNLRAREQ